MSEEQYLAGFEAWCQERLFTSEPDFAQALAFYGDALGRAKH